MRAVYAGDDTKGRDDSATRSEAADAHAHVHIVAGERAGTYHAIGRVGLLLGRTGAQLTPAEGVGLLLDDPWISRRHARLHAERGRWEVTDLGGRNRAFVDGAPLAAGGDLALADGALIRIGDTLLVFRIGVPADPDEADSMGFPGRAPSAHAVRKRLLQLSRTSGHVLVLGETGTGKERVARAMGAAGRPFVPQNCAELTREFARSELFGHLRGSFSGAIATKAGLVEVAEQGVLFLDEIGELALDVQAELLRFLEDGYYRPIGATELRRSSARLVAATNVDLDAAVRGGRFRRDLLTRLRSSNLPLGLPPLRGRREDILGWAERFFEEVTPQRSGTQWNAGTAECLLLYPWHGNLRELRGMIRGLSAAGLDLALRPEQLPADLRDYRRALRGSNEAVPVTKEPAAPELTRETIEGVLSATSGSVRATAERFGIERRKLYRLCDRLGIDLDRFRLNAERKEQDD